MNETISEALRSIISERYQLDVVPELTRPDSQHGDISTNVALKLAGKLGRKPQELATELSEALGAFDEVSDVSVAAPGFINLRLSDDALLDLWKVEPAQTYRHQVVVTEYSDPNPFKVLHAGHLYTSIMGDAISNLVSAAGGEVHKVNFGGDVGLHVGKTMWSIIHTLGGEHPEKLADIPEESRAEWLRDRYVEGNAAYEATADVQDDIKRYNKRVYELHTQGDTTSPFAQIYWTTRAWSYDAFEVFYARIGTKFEKYYPESAVADRGMKEVKSQIGEVFSESDRAVVFAGEAFGLHTRVFINGEGLPTYETKDVGLIFTKYDDYRFDRSIVITGNEQAQYMSVVLKAIEQFAPELAQTTTHLTHGLVKLVGGVKMSSRAGNILRAHDVLDIAAKAHKAANQSDDERVSLGAVKYAFLRTRMGGDIIYDPTESVSIHGNSGPYLQYAYARAYSIMQKAGSAESSDSKPDFDASERALALKLSEYPEVLDRAVADLMPHHVCNYLYELAQEFNRFYEKSRIIDDPRQSVRLVLVQRYATTLKAGLELLGISSPEHL